MNKVLIIAEAGVNHNGSINLAKKLIDVAAKAGVDYVKFQTFKTENLASKSAPSADYQKKSTSDSQFDMLKKLELDKGTHEILIDYCKNRGVKFLSTAFDLDSIDLLEELNIPFYKIPSGELTNLPYLEKIAATGKEVIISTGMANLKEIKESVTVFQNAGYSNEKIKVLHCNTEYPTPMEDVNLNAMLTIAQECNVEVGYSDHTLGVEVPIAAVSLGAKVIEKHFTLDKTMQGPDHKASLEPDELVHMVKSIRNIEKALGRAEKEPTASEKKNLLIARKSLHLSNSLKKGDKIKREDLVLLRPGNGISGMRINKIIGKELNKDLSSGTMLSELDFE